MLDSAFKAITSVAPFVFQQAQRNEHIVKILKELGLDPVQPPKDVDGFMFTL